MIQTKETSMNRMIKLFQQKSNRAFDQYLLAKKKTLAVIAVASPPPPTYPTIQDVACAVFKCESDIWAKAAEILRKEELNQ
jgi:hypothetical protein